MRDRLAIIGGLVCAVTSLIPLTHKTGDYSLIETVFNASGMYIGAGLLLLSKGLDFNTKHWDYFLPLSLLVLSLGIVWIYDNYIDLNNIMHTFGYMLIIAILTFITTAICLYYKLRQKQQ